MSQHLWGDQTDYGRRVCLRCQRVEGSGDECSDAVEGTNALEKAIRERDAARKTSDDLYRLVQAAAQYTDMLVGSNIHGLADSVKAMREQIDDMKKQLAEQDEGGFYAAEKDAGIVLPWRDRTRLSLDVRNEQIAKYRAENPEASEPETYIALDYEEYRRIIEEQRRVLEVRERRIQELRRSQALLRDTVKRFQEAAKKWESTSTEET